MCGAIFELPCVGLRPICTQACAKPCTAAQERVERSSAMLPNWLASVGISPCGNSVLPYMVGLKLAGVHGPTLRSNVSVWLGAPAMRTKITFLAVFFGVTAALATVSKGRVGNRK
jgi:hypothetical protein